MFVWLDPFDFYGTTIANISSYASIVSSTVFFTLVNGRFSPSRALRIAMGANSTIDYLAAADPTGVIGMAFSPSAIIQLTGRMPIFRVLDGITVHLSVSLDVNGRLAVHRGLDSSGTQLFLSATTFTVGAWYHLEFKCTINDTTGSYDLRINGASISAQSNIDTRNGGNATFDRIRFVNPAGVGTGSVDVDDFYWLNTTAPNNDFLGDCKLVTNFPTANGSSNQWTPNVEAQNYQCVDNNPPVDTTFSSSGTVAQRQLFAFPAVSGGVLAAALVSREFKSDAGARGTSNVVKSGAATLVDAAVALGTTPTHKPRIYEVDPNTGAQWTSANLNATEWGKDTTA